MKKLIIAVFIIGFTLGCGISFLLINQLMHEYITLDQDYKMDNGSVIKKGTFLEVDKGFSEGFTRYFLYINIHDSEMPDSMNIEKSKTKKVHWLYN